MAKQKSDEGKRAKIGKAQQLMILSVFGSAIFLGTAIAVVINSINKISFSASVIMAQDQSITNLSDAIKNIGICKKPSGQVYNDQELRNCNPDSIDVSDVPGTLRANILEDIASNKALASVPNKSNEACTNPATEKNYTYKELEEKYNEAETEEQKVAAVGLIKSCSSLRIIPDALPAYENEEALLASVDQVFRDSGTEPESLSPTEEIDGAPFGINLFTISVSLSMENEAGVIHKLLNNLEHSIRNFNIARATIEWQSNNSIALKANANAYYMQPSIIEVSDKAIRPGAKK